MPEQRMSSTDATTSTKKKQSHWIHVLNGINLLLIIIGLGYLIWYGYRYNFTGFNEHAFTKNATSETIPPKYLWDWLDLLVIPIIIVVGGYYLNRSEERRKREIASEEREADRVIAEKNRQAEQQQALEHQREESLQNYIDKMTELLLTYKLKETSSGNASYTEAKNVARAKTLATVRTLDGKRKGLVLKFLFDAGLISGERPIISLEYADFSETVYPNAYLGDANLTLVEFSGAKLEKVEFSGANLTRAIFNNATLRDGKFKPKTNTENDLIVKTIVDGTEFKDADLAGIHVADVDIKNVDFRKISMSEKTNKEHNPGDLTGSVWENCTFEKCAFIGVQFRVTRMIHVGIKNQTFDKVNFEKSGFTEVDFSESRIKDSSFYDSGLNQVNFNGTELDHVRFDSARLLKVNFSNSTMNKMRFRNSIVHTDLTDKEQPSLDADFSGVTLVNEADITGANFTEIQKEQLGEKGGVLYQGELIDDDGKSLLDHLWSELQYWLQRLELWH